MWTRISRTIVEIYLDKGESFTCSSELNEKCAVRKISQLYTNSHLTSVARYELQKFWIRLRRNKKKLNIAKNIHTVWTVENKEKWKFKQWLEEWKKNKNFDLGVWTPIGVFERPEAVQTQRKSYRLEGSNGGK